MATSDVSEIRTRPLGTTGVNVSMLSLGGAHLGKPSADEAIRLVHAAIDNGITFMDNAWEYNDHESERRMGIALAQNGYRDKSFLMTKNCAHDRTYDNSMVKLEESLRRLQTDYLDLWQIHEVVWPDDPDRIFAPGGAAEAMVKAKEQGKVRFIGFTGHKSPSIFRRMLAQNFAWDTLQMPVSVLDASFNSFQREIFPVAQEQGIGVIGMKSLAAGHIFDDPTIDITAEHDVQAGTTGGGGASFADRRSRSSTSRLENRSSSSTNRGCEARARASATRCCCPPDSSCGYLRMLSCKPTARNASRARSRRNGPRRCASPKATFPSASRCGNSA